MNFTIYTTGIVEWGDLNLIARYWQENIRNNIINKIPNFYNIKIVHCDILLNINNIHINDLINNIYENICLQDLTNNRVIESIFRKDKLDFQLISLEDNYIILDFAHIFAYDNDNYVYIYNEPNIKYKLNVIYLGYVSILDYTDNFSNRYIENSNYIIIYDKYIITYIQRMNELNISYNPLYPNEKIRDIFKNIRLKLINNWREKYNIVLFDFDNLYNNEINNIIVQDIIDYIMTKNYTENEIINNIYNKFIL
jgi:hypothetical protein